MKCHSCSAVSLEIGCCSHGQPALCLPSPAGPSGCLNAKINMRRKSRADVSNSNVASEGMKPTDLALCFKTSRYDEQLSQLNCSSHTLPFC